MHPSSWLHPSFGCLLHSVQNYGGRHDSIAILVTEIPEGSEPALAFPHFTYDLFGTKDFHLFSHPELESALMPEEELLIEPRHQFMILDAMRTRLAFWRMHGSENCVLIGNVPYAKEASNTTTSPTSCGSQDGIGADAIVPHVRVASLTPDRFIVPIEMVDG